QGIGHDVTEDAPEGQRQGDSQASEIPERGPENDRPGERTVELVAREPRLVQADAVVLDAATELGHPHGFTIGQVPGRPRHLLPPGQGGAGIARSEERRVGKEGGWWWGASDD